MKGLVVVLLLCFSVLAKGQTFQGKLTDEKGEGIPGATLYLQELAAGCVANENGAFQMELPVGVYTCEISALGYKRQVKRVEVKKEGTWLEVELKVMTYMLNEVRVVRGKEDPAYYIMRHVIARAPFHQNQVKRYTAEVYTKGSMQLEKLPRMLMWSKEVRKQVEPYMGKVFLLESLTELRFEAPDSYERKVLAFSSTVPDDMDPGEALDVMAASVYAPEVIGKVSPLSPGAFTYYRFKYEESYEEGEHTVYKIRVVPKKENDVLFDGWLYVAGGEWCIVNFELKARWMGVVADIRCMFHEVKPMVFLPTSYDVDVNVKILGIKAGGKYYSSVKYKEVDVPGKDLSAVTKDTVTKPEMALAGKKDNREEKIRKKLEKLTEKENLTNREAYKVARLSRQLMEPLPAGTVSSLEIREVNREQVIEVDSLATRRDSVYWAQVRTAPLKVEELISYREKDSLREVVNRLNGNNDTADLRKGNWVGRITGGGYFRLGKKVQLKVGGLLRAVPEYNFADGFWIGQKLDLKVKLERGKELTLMPSVYFATARKTMLWEIKGKYIYAPLSHGHLEIGTGYISADYKGEQGAWRVENMLTSLVHADNFMKFYSNRYVNFSHGIDVANGLAGLVGGGYENRRVLRNHITYNFLRKEAEPNTPFSEGGVDMPDHTSLSFFVGLDYTPRLYYKVENNRKVYLYSHWPTFSVRYKRGVPQGTGAHSSYKRLDVQVSQFVRLGLFDVISYRIQTGKFFSRRELYFPDYKHFTTTGWVLDRDAFTGGFFVADYYKLHSNDCWVQGALNYQSSYLLLKRLPFLQRFLFSEAVHVRYLWTPELRNYTEAGYSLGVGELFRSGVFWGFDRNGYSGVGVRLSVNLNGL